MGTLRLVRKGPRARMQLPCSARLFCHPKLPKLLRCRHSIPELLRKRRLLEPVVATALRGREGCLHKRAHPHAAGFRSSARAGSSIWKVEPFPSVDSTQMRPPFQWRRGAPFLPWAAAHPSCRGAVADWQGWDKVCRTPTCACRF